MKANLYPLHLFDLSLVGFGHKVFTRVFLLLADASRVVLISISPGNLKKKGKEIMQSNKLIYQCMHCQIRWKEETAS